MISAQCKSAGGIFPPALPVDSTIEISAKGLPAPAQADSDCRILTGRMARGEEAAFHEFHERYFNRLLRYLLVVAHGQEEIAREALQSACVRVARHVRRFDSEPAFWNWLARLARNCATDELRKRHRYQNLLARFFRQRPAEPDLKSRDADARFAQLVQDGLSGLPDDERRLLQRKYLDGDAVWALAADRQITEKAMESLLGRIRRKLKHAVLERLHHEENS